MDPIWTPHRFSGGWLALDVANSVVLRADAGRRVDRFADIDLFVRFAAAAGPVRADETGVPRLTVDAAAHDRDLVVTLREATDALFRAEASGGALATGHLAPFLAACSAALSGTDAALSGDGFAPIDAVPLRAAAAVSALALLAADRRRRIRICDNCGWLFLDRSRNASRRWCDMSVCGNRQKARRHYGRTQATGRTSA